MSDQQQVIVVYCDVYEGDAPAKLCGIRYFCTVCGDSEHEEAK